MDASSSFSESPVGLPFGNNDPREIALSIVAQLLTERDKLKAG